MVGLFIVAAGVSLLAIPPSLVLGEPAAYAGRRSRPTLTRPSPPEAPIQMAAKRPSPGSRSDQTVTGPAGRGDAHGRTGLARRRGATATGGPGTLTVVAVVDGETPRDDRRRGAPAPPGVPAPAERERLGRPVRTLERAGRAGRGGPRAAPARRRGRPRGQSAGQDRDHRRHRPHRPVPPRLRRRPDGRRTRHRPGPRVPVHRPRRELGAARRPTTCDPGSDRSWRTVRTISCGRSPTTSSTATSRSPTGSGSPSTRSRTRSSEAPSPRRSRACSP